MIHLQNNMQAIETKITIKKSKSKAKLLEKQNQDNSLNIKQHQVKLISTTSLTPRRIEQSV